MRTISKALKEGMKRGSAKPAGKAKVKLKDGTVFTFTLADLWEYRIDNGTSGTGSFDIGQAVIGMLKLQFENTDDRYTGYDFTDAEVTAWIGGTLNPGAENETTELVQCGIFYADEKKMSDSSITLNCLDRMAWLDTPYSGVSTQYPATIQAIVQDICNYCGIVLATAEIDFGDFVVQERPDDDALNCRDMVHYAAEICGCYARCSPEGQLELKWYDTKPLESGTYHTIDALKVFKPELEDIQITGIQVTVEKEDDRENPEVILAGTAGYVLEITGNPLIAEGQTETVAAHLYEKMAGMTFRPLEVTGIVDCSIEAGDAICVIDRKGNEYQSWATNVSYAPGSACRITCGAESPGEKNASRYSETTKAVTQLKKKLRLERTERETALAALTERLQNSSGLFCTKVAMPNGSTVYYMHDKPLLEDSGIIWKLTAEAIGISTDGGKTYPYGLDVSGTAILKRVYTIGLNASYINSGTFTAKDADGNIVFLVDVDTGRVQIDASSITMHSESMETYINGVKQMAEKAVTDSIVQYYLSDSADVMIGGKWSNTAPAWTEGKYMWSRTQLTYGNGTISITEPTCISGATGQPGKNGEDGKDGADAVMLLIESSNGTVFKNSDVATTFTVSIIMGDLLIGSYRELTETFGSGAALQWSVKRVGEIRFTPIPANDARLSDHGFLLTLQASDIDQRAVFNCELSY